ncbi:MAG: hypothetical protein U9Q30_07320, partial [Campylobacterota bacterium]|nr:hypothetical protein [Campylobacterota bacterium]
MNLKIKLSAAVAAAVFIGCGGSNSTVVDDNNNTTPELSTITGKAIDGYVANADIFYCGADTGVNTDTLGNFSIT